MSNLPDFSAHGYQAIRQLGLNAAGGRVVYLATDSKTQKQVAIKQFQFAKGAGWSEFKAIEQEIKVLQGLNHRGIPHHVGSFETEDGYCIVQEYKNAHPLSDPRSFDPDEVKQIAVSVLEILVYLQSLPSPIIHRDIKPENVVIDDQLNVYLIDFGLARVGGATTMSSMAAGTFGFMAPEQIYNKDLTEATDLYSLGATLIALLTATKSTEMDTLIDEDSKIAFQDRVPKLSLRFIEWLEQMVAPKLKERYPNAETALEELQPLYITRFPSVEFSQPSLEFTATWSCEKLTQTIAIINSTPETVLEGKWSVAPHPNDPPHSPDSHAWISFSPREFKGNQVECQITVNTGKLIDQSSGERSLILHTNSIPEIHALVLKITTAPLPFDVKKLPYLVTVHLLVISIIGGFLVARGNYWFAALGLIVALGLLAAIYLLVDKLPLHLELWDLGVSATDVEFQVFSNLFIGGGILRIVMEFGWGKGILVEIIYWGMVLVMLFVGVMICRALQRDNNEVMWIPVGLNLLVGLAAFKLYVFISPGSHQFLGIIVSAFLWSMIESINIKTYLILDEERRYDSGFLNLIMLITAAFGISLGICLKIGFLSNLYLLSATLVIGVLSVSLFFFSHLQRYRQIFACRQEEKLLFERKTLIQP